MEDTKDDQAATGRASATTDCSAELLGRVVRKSRKYRNESSLGTVLKARDGSFFVSMSIGAADGHWHDADNLTLDESDYLRFRGKCQPLCKAAIEADPTLRLVRGHYYCPIWNSREPHWWTVRANGAIHDPSKDQFPSRGNGLYEEFNGMFECSECGKAVAEDKADINGNYVFCSYECHGRFVGVL